MTSFGYDNLGRRKTVTLPDPDGAGGSSAPVTTYAYDAASNLTSETDPLGNVTAYQYDHLYRVKKLTEPDPDGAGSATSPETLFAYEAVGNRTSLTDPVGNVTTWAYDGLDRVTSETNELSDARTFEYDAAGNLVKKTDRNGRVTEYDYDNLHRLTAELWKNGGSTIRTLSYAYDAASQTTEAADPDAEYDYTRDNLGRVTQFVADITGLSSLVTFTQTFDAEGHRTSLAAEIGSTDDFKNTYTYDNLGRMTRVDQTGQVGGATVKEKRVDLAYNAAGQFTSIKRYKDTDGGASNLVAESTYTYDLIGRLTGLTHFEDTTTFADYDWTYDAFSRATSFAFSHLVGGSGSTTYTYDNTSQLTAADHSNQTDESYSYDANGNRTNSGYSTGDDNRLTSDGTFNYTYDDEGNRLTKIRISSDPADDKTVEYTWDHRNRLTKLTYKNNSGAVTKTVEHTYDVFNRWIATSVDADGAGSGVAVSEYMVYDGYRVVLAFDDGGSLTNRYLHGPAVDQVFADDNLDTDVLLWALTDNLGTVRDLVNNSGTVVNHIDYNAFGRITAETAAVDFLFAFTGRMLDRETGLQNNLHRWYDSSVGRWINIDPKGFDAGDPNLYGYVDNGPTNATDPNGLEAVGHYFFPQQWLKFFLEKGRISERAFLAGMGYCSGPLTEHMYDGPHTAYSNRVRDLFEKFYRKHYPNGGAMGADTLKRFIDSLAAGKNPVTGRVDDALTGYLRAQIWRKLRGKRFANSMEEILERGRNYPPAKKFLAELAERTAKRLGLQAARGGKRRFSKAIPLVGALAAAYFWSSDVEARGLGWGTANTCVDAVPYVGWWRVVWEMRSGDDWIDTLEEDEWQAMNEWYVEHFVLAPGEDEELWELIDRNLNLDGDPDAALEALGE